MAKENLEEKAREETKKVTFKRHGWLDAVILGLGVTGFVVYHNFDSIKNIASEYVSGPANNYIIEPIKSYFM